MEEYEENSDRNKINIIKIAGYVLFVIVLFAIVSVLIKDSFHKEEYLTLKTPIEKTENIKKKIEGKKVSTNTEEHYEMLIGKNGADGVKGENGEAGEKGDPGQGGAAGNDGEAGKIGRDGLNGLNGKDGSDGIDGKNGTAGHNGKSAFEAAVEAGYLGTEDEFADILSTAGSKILDLGNHVTILDTAVANAVTQLNESLRITNTKLNDCFTSVSNGKSLVAATITDKGINTAATDTFQVINDHIIKLSDNRYKEGYLDGAASVNSGADITYITHHHEGSTASGGGCYTISHVHTGACSPMCMVTEMRWVEDVVGNSGNGDFNRTYYRCDGCGFYCHNGGGLNGPDSWYYNPHKVVNPSCGLEGIYETGCGYQENQIISATITYIK